MHLRSLVVLGLLLGMRHALETDRLAAVATLSTTARGRMSTVMRGITWGFGHTAALLVVGGVSLWLGPPSHWPLLAGSTAVSA